MTGEHLAVIRIIVFVTNGRPNSWLNRAIKKSEQH